MEEKLKRRIGNRFLVEYSKSTPILQDLLSKSTQDLDPKLLKAIMKSLEKASKKFSGKELKEIKTLERKALTLWKQMVKRQARRGGKFQKCESPGCKKTKRINCHHIESYSTNKALRYDPRNGVCFCSAHHKFGRLSAHKSFCFMHKFMTENRPTYLDYLLNHYKDKVEITKEFLLQTIKDLSERLEHK